MRWYVPGEFAFHQQWTWAQPWVRYAELVAYGGGLARVARAHRAMWTGAVEQVDDGAAALVVGHGGGIEPALVACFPDADHQQWGPCLAAATAPVSGSPTDASSTCSSAERQGCRPG